MTTILAHPPVGRGRETGQVHLPDLPPDVVRALPAASPPPPWACRVEAVVWWHRAGQPAREALPPGARTLLPLTVGALVRYLDSPVGTYSELLACPVLLRGRGLVHTTVPFIAVDSVPSIAGGREHWALPKTLAAFAGGTVTADTWAASVSRRPFGPRFPVAGRFSTTQDAVRTARSTVRGTGRPARVDVDAEGLPPWVLPGRHPGLVLTGARLVVGPAR